MLFKSKKEQILLQLNTPPDQYSDLSPKGSVDEGITELISEINGMPGFVTTSSCAGRVSVFLEGKKQSPSEAEKNPANAAAYTKSVGGKGGGSWLFVSHDPLKIPRDASSLNTMFGLEALSYPSPELSAGARLVHFKFEPMILHVMTASSNDARQLLSAAIQAGFRESGATSLPKPGYVDCGPVVAVRSSGLALESLIGFEDAKAGTIVSMVSNEYLLMLAKLANQRFRANEERIMRFRNELKRIHGDDVSTGVGRSKKKMGKGNRERDRGKLVELEHGTISSPNNGATTDEMELIS